MNKLKNYVYKIVFKSRIERSEPPYYYIGSKTNSIYKNGFIYDNRGKIYLGSSRYDGYKELCESEELEVVVLYESSTNENNIILKKERIFQKKEMVKTNPEYFNLEYASENNKFAMSNYGTYKHKETGKVIRLSVDDELVLNGTYVGATFGNILSEETKAKISIGSSGINNGFYGMIHTEETKEKISKANTGLKRTKEVCDALGDKMRGVPKSKEHRKKLSEINKALVNLKHPDTLDSVRIHRDEMEDYKSRGYMNAYALSMLNAPKVKCPHCDKMGKMGTSMKRWHFDNCRNKQE